MPRNRKTAPREPLPLWFPIVFGLLGVWHAVDREWVALGYAGMTVWSLFLSLRGRWPDRG